jgi:hypothetical protein
MVLLDPICQLQNHPEEGVALRDVGEVEVDTAALGQLELEVIVPRREVQPQLPDRQG